MIICEIVELNLMICKSDENSRHEEKTFRPYGSI